MARILMVAMLVFIICLVGITMWQRGQIHDGDVEAKDVKMTDGRITTIPTAHVLKLKGINWDGQEIEAEIRLKVKNP